VKQKWHSLSTTEKIAIVAGAGALLIISIIVFAICCIKQRRSGRREKAEDDAAFERQRSEVLAYQADMSRMGPGSGINPAYVQAMQSLGNAPGAYGDLKSEYAPSLGSYRSEEEYPQSMRSMGGGRGYQRGYQ
jgi:hypothetical protein